MKALRRRLSVRAASLGTAFEELAQAYEELTARDPPQANEYRGSAEAARKAGTPDRVRSDANSAADPASEARASR